MSPLRYLALGATSLLACVVLFGVMSRVVDQEPMIAERSVSPPLQFVEMCAKRRRIEQALIERLGRPQRCMADSDCRLVTLACPFGCYKALTAEHAVKAEELVRALSDEVDVCPSCVYRCVSRAGYAARCVANRCATERQAAGLRPAWLPWPEPPGFAPTRRNR